MNKIIYFFSGIILISISTLFLFLYLNLLNIGCSFYEYLKFCFCRLECLLFIPGIVIVYFTCLKK